MNDWTLFESACVFLCMLGIGAVAGILTGLWELLKPVRKFLAEAFYYMWY